MHNNSLRLMAFFRDSFMQGMKDATVLDIGARVGKKRQKPYRVLFSDYKYTGMDIKSGSNVDIVGYENIKDKYDVVISGQVLEHVEKPWEWIKQVASYSKKYVCIIVPHTWEEHRYPIDCWRVLPDGMRVLFNEANIKEVLIVKKENDTLGIGEVQYGNS
jgi:2-polyprenyl-3-methyl-5-hydroxy-6-metoxy-1,4-benzoquinol methylase